MRKLLLLTVVAVSLLLFGCGDQGEPIETTMDEDIIEFEFTTQDEGTLSSDDLAGKYWIANMVFTNCETVCLPMTANMKILQDKMKDEGLDNIELVSFSVEPDYDSPDVLKAYGEDYDADFSNWTFLTGYDFETIKEISVKSFRSILAEAPEGTDQVTHGVNFYLVNPDGIVIKNYNGTKSANMDSIMNDLRRIAEAQA